MSRLGADPLQMEQLADVFDRESRSLRRSVLEINYLLRFTFWLGGRSDQFNAAWQQRDRRAMDRAAEQLAGLAGDLRRQAAQQVEVSSGASLRPFTAPGSGSGLRDQPPSMLAWSQSWGGGRKLGPVIEYLPEYEVRSDYYRQMTPEGTYETRANSSVFFADKWGIDVGDLDAVIAIVSGPAAAAKFAGDALIGGPSIDASIAVGVGVEYRWYDMSSNEGRDIYDHFQDKSTSTVNRFFGKFGEDEVHKSISDNDVASYDSVVAWKSVDGQLDVASTQGLLPKAGIGIDTSLLYGTEFFESGETAKIVRGNTYGGGYVDAGPLADLESEFAITKVEGELGLSYERRLIYGADGNPERLEIIDTIGAAREDEKGLFVSEGNKQVESITTKYTFDLTDPETAARLEIGSNEDILPLSGRALRNVDLAYGERYTFDASGGSVDYDIWWVYGGNEAGEAGHATNTELKPVGSSEFRSWLADS